MQDIKKLKVSEDMDHILLHIVFDDKFPYSPPFVRIVKPVINGGYVTAGGAICMELLTPQVRTHTLGLWRGRGHQCVVVVRAGAVHTQWRQLSCRYRLLWSREKLVLCSLM